VPDTKHYRITNAKRITFTEEDGKRWWLIFAKTKEPVRLYSELSLLQNKIVKFHPERSSNDLPMMIVFGYEKNDGNFYLVKTDPDIRLGTKPRPKLPTDPGVLIKGQ
jgi:hypothetical protein